MAQNDEVNDREKLAELWTSSYRSVAAYISTLIPDPNVVQDVLQRTAVVVVRKFDQYDCSRSFTSWAIGIARYEVLHERRRFARERLVFDDDLLDGITDSFSRQIDDLEERRMALSKCMGKLDETARNFIEQRYIAGSKPKDIARELKRSPESVRMALMRIRKSLRKCIERQMASEAL